MESWKYVCWSYLDILTNWSWDSRTSRRQFWAFWVLHHAVVLAVGILLDWFATALVYWVVTWVPYMTAIVRRLHDTGRSGGWFFIGFIPYLGSVILLILLLQGGGAGNNGHGAEPTGTRTALRNFVLYAMLAAAVFLGLAVTASGPIIYKILKEWEPPS